MPFLTNDPLPQCLQTSSDIALSPPIGNRRGCGRYLLEVKCLRTRMAPLPDRSCSPACPRLQYTATDEAWRAAADSATIGPRPMRRIGQSRAFARPAVPGLRILVPSMERSGSIGFQVPRSGLVQTRILGSATGAPMLAATVLYCQIIENVLFIRTSFVP